MLRISKPNPPTLSRPDEFWFVGFKMVAVEVLNQPGETLLDGRRRCLYLSVLVLPLWSSKFLR